MFLPLRRFVVLLLLCGAAGTSLAQNNAIISVSSDLALLLNKQGAQAYSPELVVDYAPTNLEFGLAVNRRHFSRRGGALSLEYGLRLQKMMTRLTAYGPNGQRVKPTIHQVGLSVPVRVFFNGWAKNKTLQKKQGGLFFESLNSTYFRGDVAQQVYTSHLSVGARTGGRRFYLQMSFGWPVYTSRTVYQTLERAVGYTNRSRRFGLLTVGYSLPYD